MPGRASGPSTGWWTKDSIEEVAAQRFKDDQIEPTLP